MRGQHPAIILDNPKYSHNVDAVIRTASAFGVGQVWWTGKRVSIDAEKGERMSRYSKVKLFPNEDYPLKEFEGVTPVVIGLHETAELLTSFEHPKNAVYVFGPEDGNVSKTLRMHSHRFVFIPIAHCFSLSMAVCVVMYDRLLKQMQNVDVEEWPINNFID